MPSLNIPYIPATRKPAIRDTDWPITRERHGEMMEMPEQQLRRTPNPDAVIGYHSERLVKKMQAAIEDTGYTTHPDIIRDHGEWESRPDPAYFRYLRILHFPPRQPAPGDIAAFRDGPLAGGYDTVPDDIAYTYTEPLTRDITRYEPFAFNTATGRWVYVQERA